MTRSESLASRSALIIAILVTTVAIVRVGIIPIKVPVPAATNESLTNKLKAKGWMLKNKSKAANGLNISRAEQLIFQATETNAGSELAITPTRVRAARYLDVKEISRNRADTSTVKGKIVKDSQNSILIVESRQGRRIATTCIVPGGAAVSSSDLVRLKFENDPMNTSLTRLKILLGIQQPREWTCLLAEIRIPESDSADKRLLGIWDDIGATLRDSER
jgi:hypothetical protein